MSKKSFIDSIEVKNPCTENWDEMKGNDRVRFCSHCAKNVNNLSEMTRKEAMRLVRNSGGRLCVRYVKDLQTGTPLFARTASRFVYRTGAAAGALSASLLLATAPVLAQDDPTRLVQIERPAKSGNATSKISGYVSDPNGAVIPYSLVSVTNQETTEYFVQTANAEGFYEFKDLSAGTYKVRFEAGGFEFREVTDVNLAEATELRRDAQLGLQQVSEVVQVKSEDTRYSGIVGDIGIVVTTESHNALVQAVYNDDLEDVKARVMMRAKVNVRDKSYDGITPLHAAVETGNIEIAQFLLEHGAKPNIRDFQKRTPLMMMAEDATPELFQLLVRYGAKVNLVDKEKNNILHHFAATASNEELLRQLTTYGVPVNAVNKNGETPLMIASENDHLALVRVLLENGANVNLGNGDKSAWDLAEALEIKGLLETYGATPKR